jgi:hypothetical protein
MSPVVERTATVDVAAVARRAERRERPFLRVDGDDVAVPHVEQRLLLPVALQTRNQIRSLRIGREDLDGNPFLLEHRLDEVGDEVFVSRRILRVKAYEGLEISERLIVETRPVGRRAVLRADTLRAADV